MSKYNIEDFKSKLKEDHDKIKETLEKLDIPRGTESENINNILRVFLIALIEYKISKLKDHLRSLPKLVLSFGHSELNKILDYIDKNYSKFKNNPVVVTAHFDHIGHKKGTPAGQDSIYNGARDNIVGVTAMLVSAKALQKLGHKRPVLFLAFTGEEKGLLGSRFYVQNPLMPLKKTYFGINFDNAVYNDTSIVSLIGLSNYKNDSLFIKPILEMGLKVLVDPVPQLRLFERSDNILLTQKGVPTMSYSLGFTDFTDELNKYYHQLADESSSLDYNYLERFYESFTNVLYYVANSEDPIEWKDDSKWNPKKK